MLGGFAPMGLVLWCFVVVDSYLLICLLRVVLGCLLALWLQVVVKLS